jgi:hypothetical protein
MFSPVSCKDTFKIIVALVTHYDLELHQMDIKMTFLNGDMLENVYMTQPKGFAVKEQENLASKKTRRTIAFIQSSRMGNLFSFSCMWMTFYLPVVMLI